MLIFKKTRFYSKKNIIKINFLLFPLLCTIIFGITYFSLGKKVNIVYSSSLVHKSDLHNLEATVASIFADPSTESLDDKKFLRRLNEEFGKPIMNTFTKYGLKIEDSPGNIMLIRKNGKIVKVIYYWSNGIPLEPE